MGAWGIGYFEDDSALDFMADIEDSDNPKQTIRDAISDAIDADYLESDQGTAAIIAAIYVDKQVNGTKYSSSDNDEPLDVDTFPERHPEQNFSDLKSTAVQALTKVLEENSELNELWAESEENYSASRQGVEQIISRLTK